MLTLGAIDLEMLRLALDSPSDWDSRYWFDPRTGETSLWLRDSFDEAEESWEDLEAAGAIVVEPIRPYEAYRDMELFIADVKDERAKDLLWRAIDGKGAFRRFRNTLAEFPELETRWFSFHDRAMRRRAIEWLAASGVVEQGEAENALRLLP
ncbi:UPF0158 family protein [Pseudarthrobacter sp. HLT3-5]|uniref:UPF0158 family protein n=1 Tax=Pseudarthrobacter cellobiosi TaxID=2953654 RepID=UPI00208EA3DB|nr:UPF0158 family protein [Pseudarthrobacter sp. HLT3-5]MCO4273325.1 UPF0158 family protein [Pseudarthrobacter sp. HLT3-5]